MKKILMTASTFGHFLSFHQPYVEALQQKGFLVDLAAPLPDSGSFPTVAGVHECFHVPFQKKMFSPENFKATGVLRKKIKENQYDLLICHTSLASFFTRLAVLGRKSRPKVVYVVHGLLTNQYTTFLKKCLLLGAECLLRSVTDLTLTMNKEDLETAKKYRFSKEIRPILGMGFVPTQVLLEEYQHLRESLSLPDFTFLLCFGGEFIPRKNQKFLIQSLVNLPKNVHLVLAGRGKLEEDCKNLAKSLELSHRIHFLGFVNNLPAWYRACDLVVSACVSEGLPFHLMEGMYQGKACLVSEVKGHCDLIENQCSGLLFPYNDEEIFRERVVFLMENPNLAVDLGENGRIAVTQFQLDSVLPQVVQAYLSVMDEG